MSRFNYHTHTSFCDGNEEPEIYIKEAINRDMNALGFSSHAPFLYETKWAMKKENLPKYTETITNLRKLYKNQINICLGLEIDYVPNLMGPSHFMYLPLDYSIGSIHYISQFPDGKYWGIDGTKEEFIEGYENIFKRNPEKVIKEYYSLVQQMIIQNPPDIIAHLDVIKKNNKDPEFFTEDDRWYKKIVFETLKIIKESNRIIEVNTRGIYTGRTKSLYPSPWILEKMNELKIPVIISSDAHKTDELTAYFYETADILYSIGFKEISVFENNHWTPYKLNQYLLAPSRS